MRIRVQSLACSVGQGFGVAGSCDVCGRHGSDPVLLWLCCRLAATALIQPLAWEPLYAAGAALKRQKKKKLRKKRKRKRGDKRYPKKNWFKTTLTTREVLLTKKSQLILDAKSRAQEKSPGKNVLDLDSDGRDDRNLKEWRERKVQLC